MTGYDHESLLHVEGIDRALTEIQRQIDFLLNITPTNSNEAWLDFEKSGFSTVPMLQSRPLRFEPDLIKRQLYDLAIEQVDEVGLAILLRQKRDELCRPSDAPRGPGLVAFPLRQSPAIRSRG